MAEVWWLSDTKDLHRIEDRISTLYVERCHVDRDDNAVVLVNKERAVRVPAAFVATVLLGPGTRITSPALGFIHTGGATSFVLDIADLYKGEFTIPLAFDLAASGRVKERDARSAFRDKVADGHLMARIVHDIKDLILEEGVPEADDDALHLWDEVDGHVPGGVDWAADLAQQSSDGTVVGVTGPNIDEQPPPW